MNFIGAIAGGNTALLVCATQSDMAELFLVSESYIRCPSSGHSWSMFPLSKLSHSVQKSHLNKFSIARPDLIRVHTGSTAQEVTDITKHHGFLSLLPNQKNLS